jgi:exodeoxyribonuclease VII large subunit
MRRIQDERLRLRDLSDRIKKNALRIVALARKDLEAMLVRLRPDILTRTHDVASDDLMQLNGRLSRSIRLSLEDFRQRLSGLVAQLETLSPLKVMLRGYSITFKVEDGSLVNEAQAVSQGEEIRTLVSDGEIISVVTNTGKSNKDT